MWNWRRPEPDGQRANLGRRGERRAAWYLRWRGYRVLARNVRSAGCEIDLIVQRGDIVAFVEVKTRRSAPEGFEPERSVGPRKQAHLVRAGESWIARHGDPALNYRFDILTVVWPEGGRPRVTHFPDAFRPGGDRW